MTVQDLHLGAGLAQTDSQAQPRGRTRSGLPRQLRGTRLTDILRLPLELVVGLFVQHVRLAAEARAKASTVAL